MILYPAPTGNNTTPQKTLAGIVQAMINAALSGLITGVSSVFGRTGAVIAQSGDYTASQVTNVPAGGIVATDVQAAINELDGDKQPLDATLTALAAYNTNGLLTQTAADTFTGRTITGTTDEITVTNGNGVSGNPTLAFSSNGLRITSISSDVATTATTYSDITGLSFSVVNGGTYFFRFYITYTANVTATGQKFGVNGPTNSYFAARINQTLGANTVTPTNITAYDTGNLTANTLAAGSLAVIEGFITATANGTVIGRFATETAVTSTTTVKAGSFVEYRRIL